MKKFGIAVLITILVSFGLGAANAAGTRDAANDMSWLDGFTLVVLEDAESPLGESAEAARLHMARETIQSHGGRVAIMSPPSFILGWIPYEYRAELIGKAGIKDIFYTEVMQGEVRADDVQSRAMIGYYNAVVRGDIQRKFFEESARASVDKAWPEGHSDALQPGPIDESMYIENLEAAGLDVKQLKDQGLLLSSQDIAGNSDRMTGTVSLTLFFVESDGSGADPDLYTWTDQHMQDYVNGTNTGLAWWTQKAYQYFDCWNAFFVRYYPATDSRCQQQYEPVLNTSGLSSTWVSTVIGQFGYTSGNVFSRVTAYNTWQRSTYGTNWAYSGFIAYNPPPAADRFTNGTSAFAYLGGPYTVLLYRSYSWNVDQVFTHESGHIFRACDEYASSGCGCTCNGLPHNNCENCSGGGSCMMNNNAFTLCAWTPAQIGWSGMGCAPTPLPAPTAATVSPQDEFQGLTTTVTITGGNFLYGAGVDMGPDITVNSTTFVNPSTITADITIHNDAALGWVDVTVANRDLQSATLPGAFEIKQTTVHYASPTGGNVFPYITPGGAATSLLDAIDAAGNSDSVLVESATIGNVNINITTGIEMYGAWNSSFTSRDLVAGKTVIDLAGTVWIGAGANPVVVDGFVIENGEGHHVSVPSTADLGGGVYVSNSTVTVSNCEIRSNLLDSGDYSAGGGLYAIGSTVDLHDNIIEDNMARQGGGIFLDGCSGSVANNTITGNQIAFAVGDPHGGGVDLQNCTSLVFSGNTIDGNTANAPSSPGAHGGGFHIMNSTAITMTGDVISHNAAGANGSGGGIYLDASVVTMDGVTLSRNSSPFLGGAVACSGTSVLTMTECDVSWNTGFIGGGLYISTGGEAFIDHNLFVGNSGTVSGGGCYFLSPVDGSFIGNTMDRNTSSSTGGVLLSDAAIPVFNNIIINSGDVGVTCSGAGSAILSYNDVWNSANADYSGCTPGAGSITGDPLFADTAGVDYRLTLHSPAIDAGDPDPAYDDPDGSRGDMGRFGSHAFVMEQPSYVKNLVADATMGNALLTWNANPELDVAFYAVYKDTSENFIPSVDNYLGSAAAPDTTFDAGPAAGNCFYKVSAIDSDSYAGGYSNSASASGPTAIGDDEIAYRFNLHQNVPNPFNPVTQIRYEITERSSVSLTVYDVQGRRVTRLVNGTQAPGFYHTMWNGTNQNGEHVSSGIYFYRLVAGSSVQTKKMVMLK